MEFARNPHGQRANLLAQERLQFYYGHAIIEIHHLAFESDAMLGSRPLDHRNVERLRNLFELEGCANLEPEHKVAATISEHTLQGGLAHSGIRKENLFDQVNPHRLAFQDDVRLVCAYGKHRLQAGESFGEYEWLVELYSSSKYTMEIKRQCQQCF